MAPDFQQLYLKAGSIFSPAAPVDKKSLFAGRIQQLSRIIDAINTRGQHAIVFGERGVGKTSLANILHETLESIGLEDIIVNRVNCDSTDNFSSVWRKALKEVVYIAESSSIGFEPETKQYVMDLSAGTEDQIVPGEICKAFRRTKSPLVFIFDEFDRINDMEAARMFADTMKSLSDNSVNGTLVLVGVADDVNDLIEGHESVSRSLVEIKVPRMSEGELREILQKASNALSMSFAMEASNRLLKHSQGLPHYTHLLGLLAVRACLSRESMEVERSDVQNALFHAVENAQQSIISTYQKATSSPHKGHLYRHVLLACALAKGDEMGYFAATDVRDPLSRIMGKKYEIPAFSQHLYNFCSEDRGRILAKVGTKRNYRYRFSNPLLPPFIIIRGFVDELLDDSAIDWIPMWST